MKAAGCVGASLCERLLLVTAARDRKSMDPRGNLIYPAAVVVVVVVVLMDL